MKPNLIKWRAFFHGLAIGSLSAVSAAHFGFGDLAAGTIFFVCACIVSASFVFLEPRQL